MKHRPRNAPAGARHSDSALAAQAAQARDRFKQAFELHKHGQIPQAEALYHQVLRLWPGHPEALHLLGMIALQKGQTEQALEWVNKSLLARPDDAPTLNTQAVALNDLNRHAQALGACDHALRLRPEMADVHYNRGNALMGLERMQEAVQGYAQAIRLEPDYAKAYANAGLAFAALRRFAQAIAAYDKAIALGANIDFLLGNRLQARMPVCDWTGIEPEIAAMLQAVDQGQAAATPMTVLALTDRADLHLKAAQTWVARKHPPATPSKAIAPKRKVADQGNGRIRVGYFSMDFRNHPVSWLTAGVFEHHDRERFEIFAFSYGPATGDEMHTRLQSAFDRFIDIRHLGDDAVVQLVQSLGLDIAVDLAGLTGDARTSLFARRLAPVQVNYIGFPGTMGAPYMDYIIADETLVPASSRGLYSEKIASLPCFQANDRIRRISDRVFSRAELGLAHAKFVFCNFNRSYKLVPAVFHSWMRILASVPGSMLLLHSDSDTAQNNLREHAAGQGIDPARLVFCAHLPVADYLARFRAADLFLDSFPFNGGTTVSDALWAGLPLLTYPGQAFASRMAASLLTAIELPELIAADAAHYEARAIELALDPMQLAALRAKLARNRLTTSLFDTAGFTRHLEKAYDLMHERSVAGQAPDHIHVSPTSPSSDRADIGHQ